MACPVIHGNKAAASASAEPALGARDRVVAMGTALLSTGCDMAIAHYNVCQQKVAREGTGHCAAQAEAVLECETRRRSVIRSLLGSNTLVGAFDACVQQSSEEDCLVEARAVLSKAAREMM